MDLTLDLEPGDDIVYVAEAVEQIEAIERGLLALERNAADEATLGEIFRAAHTLKGSAATIGHRRMAEVTHALEEVFGALRSGHLKDLGSFDDLLLPTVDVLRTLVDEVAAGHTLTDAPTPLARAITDRLAGTLAGTLGDAPTTDGETEAPERLDPGLLARLHELSSPAVGPRSAVTFTVRDGSDWSAVRLVQGLMAATDTGRLLANIPSLEEIERGTAGSTLSMMLGGGATEFEDLLDRLRSMDDAPRVEIHEVHDVIAVAPADGLDTSLPATPATHRSAAQTIRIEVGQLDDLMNLAGELIVQKTRLRRHVRLLAVRLGEDDLAAEADDVARQFAQIVDRLQAGVTQLRMMPFESVFSRLPRLVRDLSAQLGKDVDLVLEGRDTELDRSLLEAIGDPIGHIVRNALDHGIEPGADRVSVGKPPRGTIRVTARHEDGRVIVEVADDGRGMDPAMLMRTAVKRRLIDRASAAGLTDAEALRLVFLPGFSTAQAITGVSGRGVGMDVVQTNVERLGGQVSIRSTVGAGTTIAMSLPLTLAIIDVLLVRSGARICAIPLRSVVETQRVPRRDVLTVASHPVVSLPRGVVPLLPLAAAMGDTAGETDSDEYVRAVIVRSRGTEKALGVDAFLGTEEIVIKPLGLPGEQPDGVVGATILADGAVALVVDVDRLVGPESAHLRSA